MTEKGDTHRSIESIHHQYQTEPNQIYKTTHPSLHYNPQNKPPKSNEQNNNYGAFFIAVVPIAPDPFLRCSCDPIEANSSQKSLRSGSCCRLAVPGSSGPSTNRLKESAAPRAPACRFWPRFAARRRACAAKSDSASCYGILLALIPS